CAATKSPPTREVTLARHFEVRHAFRLEGTVLSERREGSLRRQPETNRRWRLELFRSGRCLTARCRNPQAPRGARLYSHGNAWTEQPFTLEVSITGVPRTIGHCHRRSEMPRVVREHRPRSAAPVSQRRERDRVATHVSLHRVRHACFIRVRRVRVARI